MCNLIKKPQVTASKLIFHAFVVCTGLRNGLKLEIETQNLADILYKILRYFIMEQPTF